MRWPCWAFFFLTDTVPSQSCKKKLSSQSIWMEMEENQLSSSNDDHKNHFADVPIFIIRKLVDPSVVGGGFINGEGKTNAYIHLSAAQRTATRHISTPRTRPRVANVKSGPHLEVPGRQWQAARPQQGPQETEQQRPLQQPCRHRLLGQPVQRPVLSKCVSCLT